MTTSPTWLGCERKIARRRRDAGIQASRCRAKLVHKTMCGVVQCVLMAGTAYTSPTHADDLDPYRYRYVLENNAHDRVCDHMNTVFNVHFRYPWKRPALGVAPEDLSYGPKGKYAFPLLPGVTHDNRMAALMSYSRLPTSPEFQAINWREGRFRIRRGQTVGYRPMLIAVFDINNDGHLDTVFKTTFMRTFDGSFGGGDGDTLVVFSSQQINLGHAVTFGPGWKIETEQKSPAVITQLPSMRYRLIRPFISEGVTYLAAYAQHWPTNEAPEIEEGMDVLRYRGVTASTNPAEPANIVHVDRVCEFQMSVIGRK